MGIVHPTSELTPSKADLLAAWLPAQPWWPRDAEVRPFEANFRLDDPTGEVGIETFLLPVPGGVAQVPVTYRSAPLDGGVLVGELEHSVLGHRWVYDGPSDPVYVAETTAVIRHAGTEVDLVDSAGQTLPRRRTTAAVRGSGDGAGELHVVRLVPGTVPAEATGTLSATWVGQPEPAVLAWLGHEG